MPEHVTLIREDASGPDARLSAVLPPDLMDQVRSRVSIMAALITLGFSLDLVLFGVFWSIYAVKGQPLPLEIAETGPFQVLSVAAVTASAVLWVVARNRAVSSTRLLSIGLVYEVVICFLISFETYWSYYAEEAALLRMTWIVVVIIMFPLVVPGPPRTMLRAAIASAAMAPLGLFLLDVLGKVPTLPDAYVQSITNTALAVVFAYVSARVVHGLGKQVAEARQMGSYRLEERLGEGGMGEVWRARHRMLARPAAIKLIRPEVLGADGTTGRALARFEREAQATAALRSPHTVELYDFGATADGTFYYVMELLDGLDTASLIGEYGPIPAARAVHILRQVCHSLGEAHTQGLIHRDIKPANIYLCRYGQDVDFAKVLDFGLVKSRGESERTPALTGEHIVGGTPAFIAPEQALGDTDLDGRVDIYALGCVAHWLLTGQLVFPSESPMQMLMDHAHTPPPPLSQRTELPIPVAIERLVLSCLEKDRDARPQTAGELAVLLEACALDGSWTPERAGAWWASHRRGAVPETA